MNSISPKRAARLEQAGQRLGCNSTIALPSTPGRHKPRKAIKRSGKVKPKKRTPSEFARIYGSRDRVRWIKGLPCHAAATWPTAGACAGPIENAHAVTGGMGRKADADTIVPFCHAHHVAYDERRGIFANVFVRLQVIGSAAAYDISWTTRTT